MNGVKPLGVGIEGVNGLPGVSGSPNGGRTGVKGSAGLGAVRVRAVDPVSPGVSRASVSHGERLQR